METDVRYEILTSEVTYTALRAAFLTTLDCLLRESLEQGDGQLGSSGFLDWIPALAGTAPQVQLECLLSAWGTLQNEKSDILTPIEQCVCLAATEVLAQLSAEKNQRLLSMIWQSPRVLVTCPDHWLYSKIRCFQSGQDWSAVLYPTVMGENELVLAQIHDVPSQFGRNDDILDVVGRWRAEKAILLNSVGLLNVTEQDIVRTFFEEHPELLA